MVKKSFLISVLLFSLFWQLPIISQQIAEANPEAFKMNQVLNRFEKAIGSGTFQFSVESILETSDVSYINVFVDINSDGLFNPYEKETFYQNEWIVENIPLPMTDEIFSEPMISLWFQLHDTQLEWGNEFAFSFSITDHPLEIEMPLVTTSDTLENWYNGWVVLDYSFWGINDPAGQEMVDFIFPAPFELPDEIVIHETPGPSDENGMPDIAQQYNECGPTSAANSLLWLASENDFLDKLPQTADGVVDTSQLILDLMEAMTGSNERPFGGLRGDQMLEGKRKFAEDNELPITVEGGMSDTNATGANSLNFIMSEINRGQDVELLVWWPGTGGHWVTVTGYGIANGKAVIYVHDPDDDMSGKAVWTLETNADGKFTGNITAPDSCSAAWAVAESPLPTNILGLNFEQIFEVDSEGEGAANNLMDFSVTYTPTDVNQFLNVTAKHVITDEPVWIVRNLLLPGKDFVTEEQTITTRFPTDILGFADGATIDSIDIGWNAYNDLITTLLLSDRVLFSNYPVNSFYEYVSNGRDSGLELNPVSDAIDWFFDHWSESLVIKDLVYHSCNPDESTHMPNIDLDKATRDGELNGCGPAAAANSLNWLENNHDQINFPPDLRNSFNELSNLMNRLKNRGVGDRDFIKAKLDFIEMYNLPIKVKFQDNSMKEDIKSTTGRTTAECKDKTGGGYPTKDWMINEAKEDEDVEVGMTYPDGLNGHWVTLNGTVTFGDTSYLYYKDDKTQEEEGGNKNSRTKINIKNGKMVLPGLSNATVDIVVSESYDPDYRPPSSTANYEKYCQWTKRIIPPGYKLEITYPEEPVRCYNSTIWVLDRTVKPAEWKKDRVWNFNRGKTRTFTNDTDLPITIAIHNDDKYSGSESLLKANADGYTIDIPVAVPIEEGDVTEADNENEYAGFSIGADDDSSEEFGDSLSADVVVDITTGMSLASVPSTMNSDNTNSLTLHYTIPNLNVYWDDLELNFGVAGLISAGGLKIESNILDFVDTLNITSIGDYILDIGGVDNNTTPFDITFSVLGYLDFSLDNIGIVSKISMLTGNEDIKNLPTEYRLNQNYPNPFNPNTTISFALVKEENVSIVVYDILGNRVTTIVNKHYNAGYHDVIWDASNLSSGIYFYTLRAGAFTETKKAVILK